MNSVLSFTQETCYDIIVYSPNWQHHLDQLGYVFLFSDINEIRFGTGTSNTPIRFSIQVAKTNLVFVLVYAFVFGY
jgi:hypothetical protein